jgi:hypothetical protein
MHASHLIAYFFGAAFFTNAIPHFVAGVMGAPFQSPFAKPPGKGLSSSNVNVLWGFVNFVFAYLLLERVGRFHLRTPHHAIAFGAGMLLMGLIGSYNFGPLHGGVIQTEETEKQ